VVETVLGKLVAEKLASVIFVRDYVQLDFDDARLTAYVWPTVTTGTSTVSLADAGYRDALCSFIGHEVLATTEAAEVGLVVEFDSGSIVINPEPTELRGPEIAQLSAYDPMWQTSTLAIWRPGEDPFVNRDWAAEHLTGSLRQRRSHRATRQER
jgi:hypothetical protein